MEADEHALRDDYNDRFKTNTSLDNISSTEAPANEWISLSVISGGRNAGAVDFAFSTPARIVASPSDMLLSATANAFAAAALVLVTTLSNPPPPTTPIPVLEVIKVYGHLASTECFGAKAPPGSSCQLSLSYLTKELGLVEAETSISLNDFGQTVQQTKFQWPLKPFGIDKSLTKTATMNKGAETRVYMEELEKRGLYDKRNPTGPLPTSLRPKLNQELETEELDPVVVQQVYAALNGGDKGADLTIQRLQQAFQGQDALDYYSFLDLIGKGYIIWPQ